MIWKKICGFNYFVSDDGQVMSGFTHKLLRPTSTSNGYRYVVLANQGKTTTKKIHRLVAETFIPNPNNLPQVNHIDGDKTNNSVANLEWVTAKENAAHFWRVLDNEQHRQRLRDAQKRVASYRRTTAKRIMRIEDGKIYKSLTDAAIENNTTTSLLSKVCKGKRQTTSGYHWKYIGA